MTSKIQGFETQCIGIFHAGGDGVPLAFGHDASAATDALIRQTADQEEVTFNDARSTIEGGVVRGDYFHAVVILRGAFQNDKYCLSARASLAWLDEAFPKT